MPFRALAGEGRRSRPADFNTRYTVAGLAAKGLDIRLLSGDSEDAVRALSATVGITNWKAGVRPDEKAQIVEALSAEGRKVLMVGDGLNDSPSFEAALCAATPAVDRPVLPGKADFFFMGDGIAAIRRALGAAHHLRKVVKQNLTIAVLYNVACAYALMGEKDRAFELLEEAIDQLRQAIRLEPAITRRFGCSSGFEHPSQPGGQPGTPAPDRHPAG